MTLAEKITRAKTDLDDVYAAGNQKAYAEIEHLNAELEQTLYGTDTGGKSYYDEFWDNYQDNGKRINYQYAFAGTHWKDSTFRPKYDIAPLRTDYMFASGGKIEDLVALFEELGISLDVSKATNISSMFNWSSIRRVGVIDTTSASSLYNIFGNAKIITIDKLILKSDGSQTLTVAFESATNLESITIEGVIGKSIDIHWSPLSRSSIESIMNALSTTATGQTATFSKAAVDSIFEPDPILGFSEEWYALVDTRPNWTISLV